METLGICNADCTQIDVDAEIPPPGRCLLLKSIWMSSEQLDDLDFVNTAILIRSLYNGKLMTRARVCDILAKFRRLFRDGPTDIYEACSKDMASLLEKLNQDIAPESSSHKPGSTGTVTYSTVNQNLPETTVNCSEALGEPTQHYSNFLHAINWPTSQLPLSSAKTNRKRIPIEQLEKGNDVKRNPIKPSHSVPFFVNLPGCMQQQDEWPRSVVKGKVPERDDNCSTKISVNDMLEEFETEASCDEFTNFAQTCRWAWELEDISRSKSDKPLEDFEISSHSQSTIACRENLQGVKTSMSVDISMEQPDKVEDWFADWFADSQNRTFTQPLPKSDDAPIPTSTPVSPEALHSKTMPNLEGDVMSLWPKLPTVGQRIRRRLWEDTDMGVQVLSNGETALGISPVASMVAFDAKIQRRNQKQSEDRLCSTPQEKTKEFVQDYDISSTEPLVATPSRTAYAIAPISRPHPKEVRKFLRPSNQNIKNRGQRTSHTPPIHVNHNRQHGHTSNTQTVQKQKDLEAEVLENVCVQLALDDLLPYQRSSKSVMPVTHSYNSTQSHILPPYTLWNMQINPFQFPPPMHNISPKSSHVPGTQQVYLQIKNNMLQKQVPKPPMVQTKRGGNFWSSVSQETATHAHALFNTGDTACQEAIRQLGPQQSASIHLPRDAQLLPTGIHLQNPSKQQQSQHQQQWQHQVSHQYNPYVTQGLSEYDIIYQHDMHTQIESGIGHKERLSAPSSSTLEPHRSQPWQHLFQQSEQPRMQLHKHLPEQQNKPSPSNQPLPVQHRFRDPASDIHYIASPFGETTNNLEEWPVLSPMYVTDVKKHIRPDVLRWQHQSYEQQHLHQKQVGQKIQQCIQYQEQQLLPKCQQQQQWMVPPPTYSQGSLTNTQPPSFGHFPPAYEANFRSMVEVFPPYQQQQQQPWSAVLSMAKVAWASLGLVRSYS